MSIKCLIITHGNLGKEIISVAEGILERKTNIPFINFQWKEDGTQVLKKLKQFINENKDNKILIFTDLFGGSPTNICFRLLNNKNIEVISGINLPGLLKFITYREKDIEFKKLVSIVKKEAIEGINIISEFIGES